MTVHAIQRAKERNGLDLDFHDMGMIVKMIRDGQAKISRPSYLEGQDDKLQAIVSYQGRRLKCIYAPYAQAVVTIMPLKANAKRLKKVAVYHNGKRVA